MVSSPPLSLITRTIHRIGEMRKARENPDPTPLQPPVGYKAAPSLAEQIREMIRNERFQNDLRASGVETFEEADDFDVDDDYDPRSPWENEFDPPIREMMVEGKKELDRKAKAEETKEPPSSPPQPGPKGPKDNPPKADGQKEPPKGGE